METFKHAKYFQSLNRHSIHDGNLEGEFCLGLQHRTWFIGLVATIPGDVSMMIVVIASSNTSIIKTGSVYDANKVGKVAPLKKKLFSKITEDVFFFTNRPGLIGVPLKKFKGMAIEKDVLLQVAKRIFFSDEEVVFVPV